MLDLEQLRRTLDEREKIVASSEENARLLRLELEKDKEAFSRVADMMRSTTMELPLQSAPNAQGVAAVGLSYAVANAINSIATSKNTFSSRDVIQYLAKPSQEKTLGFNLTKNKANISARMRRLAESGVIVLERNASGRRPAQYRRREGVEVV